MFPGRLVAIDVRLMHDMQYVDVRLSGKGNLNSYGARPVHLIITMIKWIRTSRKSMQNSLSLRHSVQAATNTVLVAF